MIRRVAAIALLGIRAPLRSRLVLGLLALLAVILAGIRGDGTAQGEMRMLLTWTLGVAAGVLVFLHRFLMRSAVETEWVTSFAAVHGGPFRPDPGEIDEVRFWTRAEIEAALGSGQLTSAFEDEFARLGEKWEDPASWPRK